MELLEGLTLLELLEQRGRLSLAEAIEILDAIARSLDAAHASGIAHRDLKPANIFLARNEGFRSDGSKTSGQGTWRPKLLDFGIAKLLGDADGGAHRTETGATVGTPAYMSPEQCLGKGVDHRTDIYSFGVVAFQMLTGRLPFDADSAFSLMAAHINDPPPAVHGIVPEVPRAVDRVLSWLLAKEPDARPKTLAEAMAALAAAARGIEPGGAAPAATKQRAPLILAAAAAVLVAGVAAFFALRPAPETLSETVVAAPPPVTAPPTAPPAPVSVAAKAPAPASLPATVNIDVEQIPADARVLGPDGMELRKGAGGFTLPRGTAPLKLSVEAPGHRTHDLELVPDRDETLVVELEALPRPAARPGPPAPASKPRGVHDLEPWQ
jgi:serine/threonine-protein kinase